MRPYVAERPNGRLPKPNHQMLFLVSDGIAALEACTLALGLWLTRRACSAVLADAKAKHGMGLATSLVLSGGSAGGTASE